MLCGFSSLWWPFGWNWSYLAFLGIIWRTCGSKCRGEGGGIFLTLCVECCLVVVMQSLIMNSYEVFIHIHQGCFAGTGAIVRLPQCQWSKPDGYGKISQCITTTKHSKAKTVCIFLGIYCMCPSVWNWKKMDNFMCLLEFEFECAQRPRAHSQAIPG